ncbi:hypothetical protein CK203_109429 [Vitis vinifera]|uniref:DUF4283 domain-containing protein n=1 Tax=Vitis vinifera TaxID=29760 RepID=A0A438CVX9_VITVI|nr:hypothetical protein CK203_109429 [Vitis vinifera]
MRGKARPSLLEVEAKEEVYVVSLWWECRPVLRRNRKQKASRHSSEVRGKEVSRAEQRVMKEWVNVRLETLNPSDEGTGEQGVGSGRVVASAVRSLTTRTWAPTGTLSPIASPNEPRRVGGPGLKSGVMGLKMKGVAASEISPEAGPSYRIDEVGCSSIGPDSPKARLSNKDPNYLKGCPQQPDPDGKLRKGPTSSIAQDQNSLQKTALLLTGLASCNPHEPKPFVAREIEDMRKLHGVARISETDKAFEEESMRDWNEETRANNAMWLTVYEACNERSNGCKELGANKSSSDKGKGMVRVEDTYDIQAERSEPEGKWEESGLAKFSQFLAMRKFAEIVGDLGLVDLPLRGRDFTWNGGQNNQAWARLDRFLMSPSWIDQFNGINQCRLPRPVSDHFPITLVGGGIRRGSTPFRFENMWLKEEGFKDLVHSWWQGIEVKGNASYKLAIKMKEIKQKLKVWNREVFGKLESNKSLALQQVEFWDREESERILTMEETELKKEAKENYRK